MGPHSAHDGVKDVDALGAAPEGGVQAGLCCHLPVHLGAAGDENDLVADALLGGQISQLPHHGAMDVVVTDDRGDEDGVSATLDSGIDHLFHRHRCAKVAIFHPVLLDATVLDVEDLAQPDAVLVLTDSAGHHRQLVVGDELA